MRAYCLISLHNKCPWLGLPWRKPDHQTMCASKDSSRCVSLAFIFQEFLHLTNSADKQQLFGWACYVLIYIAYFIHLWSSLIESLVKPCQIKCNSINRETAAFRSPAGSQERPKAVGQIPWMKRLLGRLWLGLRKSGKRDEAAKRTSVVCCSSIALGSSRSCFQWNDGFLV